MDHSDFSKCFGKRLAQRGSAVLTKYCDKYYSKKSLLLTKFINCLVNIRTTMMAGGRGRATSGELFEIMVCKSLCRHQHLKSVTRLGGTFDQGIDIICKTSTGSVVAFQLKYMSSDPLRGKDVSPITRQFDTNLDYDIDIFCLVTLFITDDATRKFEKWGREKNVSTKVIVLEDLLDFNMLHYSRDKYSTLDPDDLYHEAKSKKIGECF